MITRKNKYYNRSRISEKKFREVLKYFCHDETASKTAIYTSINRNTINKIFNEIRQHLFANNLNLQDKEGGDFELDESYLGAKRIRGKRGRGAAGKTPVFGLLKRNGKVYVEIVRNCSKEELMPIIQGKILEGSTINTDGWKAYDGLILNGYTHHRVFHSHNEFARGKNHVNGIESFWSYCKRRLAKFNGLTDEKFVLHLKESEFRFNNRKQDLYKILLEIIRKNPLN
ncbi:MAG: IS1595 family transposase [Pelagibacterales bacterium]|nr:IS1595 family transposase [Pelagibacterales bacterium]